MAHDDKKEDRSVMMAMLKKALKPMHEYNETMAAKEKREEYNEKKYGSVEKATKTRHRDEGKKAYLKKNYRIVKVAKN